MQKVELTSKFVTLSSDVNRGSKNRVCKRAVKLKRTYSYSLLHAASRSSTALARL